MKTHKNHYDALVIGGGIYGCVVALTLKHYFDRVAILEQTSSLMSRASYVNQARIHNGYHYPRSFLTALRSHINYLRFVKEYRTCINSRYQSIYAIARYNSKINPKQFVIICQQIGIPLKIANTKIKKLFNPQLVEEVFITKEAVFDSSKLQKIFAAQLMDKNIEIILNTNVERVFQSATLKILTNSKVFSATFVFICAYSGINTILKNSYLPLLPFKHELAEILLVKVPHQLSRLGITLMDGPFFSILPFPKERLHSLSHVRYTPHTAWQETLKETLTKNTNSHFMITDIQRYIPLMKQIEYVKSMYEIKTLLLKNEIDDGRPILFRKNHGLKNLYIVMGGKIDNIYDIQQQIINIFETTQ